MNIKYWILLPVLLLVILDGLFVGGRPGKKHSKKPKRHGRKTASAFSSSSSSDSSSTSSSSSSSSSNPIWWSCFYSLVENPCSASASGACSQPPQPVLVERSLESVLQANSEQKDFLRLGRSADQEGCLSIDRSVFIPTAKEAIDLAQEILQSDTAVRWVSGEFTKSYKDLKCRLKTSVPWFRKRDGLSKAQANVLVHLVQTASFARYLERAAKGEHAKQLRLLSRKLKNMACNLRSALAPESLNSYVTPDDIPSDLTRSKRGGVGNLVTYIVLEETTHFLSLLKGTYDAEIVLELCS